MIRLFKNTKIKKLVSGGVKHTPCVSLGMTSMGQAWVCVSPLYPPSGTTVFGPKPLQILIATVLPSSNPILWRFRYRVPSMLLHCMPMLKNFVIHYLQQQTNVFQGNLVLIHLFS